MSIQVDIRMPILKEYALMAGTRALSASMESRKEFMKLLLAIASLGILLFAESAASSTIEATTADGKKIVLNDDGTWAYKGVQTRGIADGQSSKPPKATGVSRSTKGFAEFWYDPAKWTVTDGAAGEPAEFKFRHSSGDAYALGIVERIGMPFETLRKAALDNAKASAPDAKITLEEPRKVNGREVVAMQIEGTISGIPFKYYGYYWSGKAGSMQLVTFTSQNLFDEVADDFTEFLNGTVITKD